MSILMDWIDNMVMRACYLYSYNICKNDINCVLTYISEMAKHSTQVKYQDNSLCYLYGQFNLWLHGPVVH